MKELVCDGLLLELNEYPIKTEGELPHVFEDPDVNHFLPVLLELLRVELLKLQVCRYR